MAARRIRLRIWKARIIDFWNDFKGSKVGILGLFIITSFIFIAVFGPSLAPYDPAAQNLASPNALPAWVTLFPGYGNLAPSLTMNVELTGAASEFFDFQQKKDAELANMLKRNDVSVWSAKYVGNLSQETEYRMVYNFSYQYAAPGSFRCSFRWRILKTNQTGYNLELVLIRYGSNATMEYSLWDSNFKDSAPKMSKAYSYRFDVSGLPQGFPKLAEFGSAKSAIYGARLGFDSEVAFLNSTFLKDCTYALAFVVRIKTESPTSAFEVQVFDVSFETRGRVHGLLGTDNIGRDIFSQVLYGARISLIIGALVAFFSTGIGVLVGIVSGYLGGLIDEAVMRTVDLLMCLPLLPLILIVADMFKRNLFLVMFLIVALSWMSLSRMIRSQVLTLRESAFVEAAISAGAGRFYVLRKHILPNVMPITFSFLILAVPAAIMVEASLSFLGLGDPSLVTWGRIINEAMQGGALVHDAWWWLFSPAMAIVLVCLGFAFVAHSFDKVINPRLKERK